MLYEYQGRVHVDHSKGILPEIQWTVHWETIWTTCILNTASNKVQVNNHLGCFFWRNQCIDFFADSKNSHMLDFITHCTCQALRHFCRNWPGCLWLVSLREQYLTFVGIINKGVDDKCKELSYTRSQVKMNYIIIYTLIYFIPLHGFSEVLTNRKML